MMIPVIKKRCQRCEELFEIPNIKESPAKERLLEYYPCSFCGYVKNNDVVNTSGRCHDCFIPFIIVKEHCKGLCHRCYLRRWREENVTKY